MECEAQPLVKLVPTRSNGCAGADFCVLRSSSADSERSRVTRRLILAAAFCIVFMLAELIGGLAANSLAILTDAAHLLSDVASFAVAIFSAWASGWNPTRRHSFGYYRLEALGALVSVLIVWLITGLLLHQAVGQVVLLIGHGNLPQVNGKLMFVVALVGVVANVIMMFILGHSHHHHHHGEHRCRGNHDFEQQNQGGKKSMDPQIQRHPDGEEEARKEKAGNLNLRGAHLHVLGDLIQSTGVLISSGFIWWRPSLSYLDPVCTLVFSLLVLWTTLRVLRDVVEVLMEATPKSVDLDSLTTGFASIPGVVSIHELHVWAITAGKHLLSCHLRINRGANHATVLNLATIYCFQEHEISHVTIQIEAEIETDDENQTSSGRQASTVLLCYLNYRSPRLLLFRFCS